MHRGQQQDFRFLARQAREATGLGATQVKLHLCRLVELEYVLVHRAPRGQGVSYELVYTTAEHTADATIFSGLRDVGALTNLSYDAERSDQPASGRAPVGGMSVAGRSAGIPHIARAEPDLGSGTSVAADLTAPGPRRPTHRTIVAAVS